MTKINAVECNECGMTFTENDMPNSVILLYTCEVCEKDICSNCSEDHAKEETQMEWK